MIKLVKSTFYQEESTKRLLANFILERTTLSMGSECRKFEESFAAKQGRRHAVFVCNGSVANLLLIQAMLNLGRFRRGDRVGFSALTWPTNVMPLIQLGLEPVPIDCSLDTLNVPPRELENHLEGLQGFFLTNALGFCDDLPAIAEICNQQGIELLEDNCESLGSTVRGRRLGNFGVASTFSFFVGHHLSTIEGGMVCTDDEQLYVQLVMGRAHGWDRNLDPRTQQDLRSPSTIDEFYAKYTFYDIASNFRPTEINGFIGNVQLQYWDEIVQRRASNFRRFQDALHGSSSFYHYDLGHMDVPSNFSMPIVCRTPEIARRYKEKFQKADVEIRPIIGGNMTRQPFYRKYFGSSAPRPISDMVHTNGFYFGNNPDMTEEELSTLCMLLGKE